MKNIIRVLLSNGVLMILGIMSSLLIPRILSPIEYGKWQLYLLYSNYLGLFLFGYNDGLYLYFGGKKLKQVDSQELSNYFYLLIIIVIIVSTVGFGGINYLVTEKEDKVVYLGLIIAFIFHSFNIYFSLLNQAFGRFKIYSRVNVLEKFFYISLIIIFTLKVKSYITLMMIFIVSKSLVFFINLFVNREMVSQKMRIDNNFLKKAILKTKTGFIFTLSGVVSMLVLASNRIIVKNFLSIEYFGYYSLVFSMFAIAMTIVSAISVVFYPKFRKLLSLSKDYSFINDYEFLMGKFSQVILLGYYPMYFIIIYFLKRFNLSLIPLILILPTIFFRSKVSIIYLNYLKSTMNEKRILILNFSTLLLSIVLTFFSMKYKANFITASTALLVINLIWYTFYLKSVESFLKIKIEVNKKEYFTILLFIYLNLRCSILISLIIYLSYLILDTYISRKKILKKINYTIRGV